MKLTREGVLALTFEQAKAVYVEILTRGDRGELRWMCRNDRFFMLVCGMGRRDAVHPWIYARCREVEKLSEGWLDLWSRAHYKAVDLNYPVPTPDGWKKHGDLKPGDSVFGPDGKPCMVVAKTDVFTDAECYRVTTDDGQSVVVSAQHLWTISLTSKARTGIGSQREGRKTATIDTATLAEQVARSKAIKNRPFPCIHIAEAVQMPEKKLPIDPYVLGVWLGDGSCGSTRITSGISDAQAMSDNLEAHGMKVTWRKHSNAVSLHIGNGIRGKKGTSEISTALRGLGIYFDKRIPSIYAMASEAQRMALLQGLMDTDGHAKEDGQCILCCAKRDLAHDAHALCLSLGYKASICERRPLYKGEPRSYWQVQIRGCRERPPFRLKRKAERLPPKIQTIVRRIVGVQKTDTIPVSCIQVDRPDGMYLIGTNYLTTHNSTIISLAGAVQEILKNPEITIGIFSNVLALSKKLVKQIQRALESPKLYELFPDILHERPPQRNWSSQDGLIVKRKGNPKEPTVQAAGIVDGQPIGAHYDLRIYDDIVTPESVSTPEQIEKTTQAWELSLALGTADGGRAWYAGTRYHPNDTYQELIDRKVLKPRIRLCYDPDGKSVLMTEDRLRQMRIDMGERTFASQMLQNPIGDGMKTFNDDWFMTLEKLPDANRLNRYILIDSANAKKKTSDYTQIWVVGLGRDKNYYVLDGVHDRLNLAERTRALFDLVERWTPSNVFWEQIGLASDVEHVQLEQERIGWHFNISPIDQSVPKNDRIGWLIPLFENARIWFPARMLRQNAVGETYDLVQDLLNHEYHTHPVCRHDDMLDCLANIAHPSVGRTMRFPVAPSSVAEEVHAKTVNQRYRVKIG